MCNQAADFYALRNFKDAKVHVIYEDIGIKYRVLVINGKQISIQASSF